MPGHLQCCRGRASARHHKARAWLLRARRATGKGRGTGERRRTGRRAEGGKRARGSNANVWSRLLPSGCGEQVCMRAAHRHGLQHPGRWRGAACRGSLGRACSFSAARLRLGGLCMAWAASACVCVCAQAGSVFRGRDPRGERAAPARRSTNGAR